jgi:hypothetical protein
MSFSFFKSSLKRKKRIQNSTNFSSDVGSKQANKDNSKAIQKPSLIKSIAHVDGFVISSLHFKHIIMADSNALEN